MPSHSLMPRGEQVPIFPERDSILGQPHIHLSICLINTEYQCVSGPMLEI